LRSNLRYYLIAAEFETAGANLLHVQRDLEQLVSGAGIFERWADAHTLLIRVADKTGHYAIVHHATRSLRAAALQRRTVMPQALFATGYVIAKFYRPARAVETLKRAVETAEAEKQWGIALLARDCVAISLKQIGRYRESISQFNHSLALARKTMNHAAEMRCLINRGVSEIALGEYEIASDTIRAAQHFAGDVLTRGYCAFNVGIIALLSGSPEKALEHFQRCYEEADRFGAKSMASDARAAAAIACQRLNDLGRLARFTAELHATSWASQHLRLGWALATAQAWNKALVLGDFDDAIMDLERQAHAMRSRDVALWLAMQMEAILIREAKTGKREHQARQLLFDAAGKYEARGVQRTAVA